MHSAVQWTTMEYDRKRNFKKNCKRPRNINNFEDAFELLSFYIGVHLL